MSLKKIIIFILLCCSITATLYCASIFSSNGFVEENFGVDNFGAGMGFTGISSLFRTNFSIINPALLTTVNKTSFSSQVDFGYTIFKDSKESYTNKVSSLPYAVMYIPVEKNTIVGISYLEKYYFGLNTAKRDSIQFVGNYLVKDQKFGSLNKFGFYIAKKIKGISLGINVNYIFGNRINDIYINYEDNDLVDTREIKEFLMDGTNISAGFTFPLKQFRFGGFVQTGAKLHSNDKYKIKYYDNSSYDYMSYTTSNYDFPMQAGLGLGFDINDFLYAESDIRYTFWKDLNNDSLNIRNTSMISFGLSYLPKSNFFFRVPVRIGGYYRELPSKFNDNYINEKAITAGFDLPIMILNQGRLSISFAYGNRGSIGKNQYKDEFYKISIGFASTDWWRNPQKYKKNKEIPKLDPKYKEYWDE